MMTVLCVHIDDAEDMTVTHSHALSYLRIQFLDIGMLRIVWLDGQTLEHVA